MKKQYYKIPLLLMFVASFGFSNAQDTLYIPSTASVYIAGSDTISVSSNAQIAGSYQTHAKAIVIFNGDNWVNAPTATFPGDGKFIMAGTSTTQTINGGGNTASMPNIVMDNVNDIDLVGDLKIRDTLTFVNGKMVIATNDLTIGDGNIGVIEGYDQDKFVVTNHDNTSDEGFLIRENMGSTATDFPVGSSKTSYTPARMTNTGTADDFKVRVFHNVHLNGNTGNTWYTNQLSVQETWNIMEGTAGGSIVALTLQHNDFNEGSQYLRFQQYVSRYYGMTANTAYWDNSTYSEWDYAGMGNTYSNVSGDITTGNNIGWMATRTKPITTDFSAAAPTRYFTKATSITPLPVELIVFEGEWNQNNPKLHWVTAQELDNKLFIIQRSYDGKNFKNIAEIGTKANNGNSSHIIDYDFKDLLVNRLQTKIVYYRLKQVDLNGKSELSNIIELNGVNEIIKPALLLYPNPATSEFYIQVRGISTENVTIQMFDMLGKQVYISENHNAEKYIIPVSNFAEGTYIVRISNSQNQEFKKRVIIQK